VEGDPTVQFQENVQLGLDIVVKILDKVLVLEMGLSLPVVDS